MGMIKVETMSLFFLSDMLPLYNECAEGSQYVNPI
jgi:hypothetical protein